MRPIRTIRYALVVICILATAAAILASTPRKISYQGRATDAGGNPVPDGSYPAQFHLYDRPTAGTDRWSEIFPMVTTSGGLFTYLLGSNTPIPDSLFARYDSLYLEVIFNGIILSPRTPIVSVGYAMRVNTVDGASGGSIWANAYRGVDVYDTGASARTALEGFVYSPTTDTVAAVEGNALNSSSGGACGGTFFSQTAGGGLAYGVKGTGDAVGSAAAFGFYGVGRARGAGHAYGGYFESDNDGTGVIHVGVSAVADGSPTGSAIGGLFSGEATGGAGYGIQCSGQSDAGSTYGVVANALSLGGSGFIYGVKSGVFDGATFSGTSYGGYFENSANLGTNAYGVYGYSYGLSNSASSFGVYGLTEPDGTGSSAGGYFLSDSTGTGTSYGCRGIGFAKGAATAYGVSGIAANRSTGVVYGGYFNAYNYGTGTKYGVYSTAPTSGYAGYFSGDVRVTGDQTVLGTKSAAVEFLPDDYRLVYSQESPECWFEDFGEGQLVDGRAHVELDPSFLRTVTVDQQHQMKVFIQLNDPNCNGTAVIRGTTGFDVVELMNGSGNAKFTYRVAAKRRGYEDVRLARMAGPTPAEVVAQLEKDQMEQQEVERTLQQDAEKQRVESETQAGQLTQKREQ